MVSIAAADIGNVMGSIVSPNPCVEVLTSGPQNVAIGGRAYKEVIKVK